MRFEKIVELFKDPQFIENNCIEQDDANVKEIKMAQADHMYSNDLKKIKIDKTALKLDCKSWYPLDLVYELMVPRELLKKSEAMK